MSPSPPPPMPSIHAFSLQLGRSPLTGQVSNLLIGEGRDVNVVHRLALPVVQLALALGVVKQACMAPGRRRG